MSDRSTKAAYSVAHHRSADAPGFHALGRAVLGRRCDFGLVISIGGAGSSMPRSLRRTLVGQESGVFPRPATVLMLGRRLLWKAVAIGHFDGDRPVFRADGKDATRPLDPADVTNA